MDAEEAIAVLNIMSTADGECNFCAAKLFKAFVETFPQFQGAASFKYNAIFDLPLEEQ